MRVSIIIPTYNHFSDLLRPCLENIEKNTNFTDKEIVIVSNGSTDETVAYIEYKKKCGFPYKVLNFPRPIGFPKAINVGALAAEGDYILLLNNDTKILPCIKDAWINIMLDPFVRPDVAVTGPVQVTNDATNRTFILFFCALIKRSVFEQLNGLDEVFSPGYGEDVDFCIRAKLNGYKCVRVPERGRVIQRGNVTLIDFPIKHLSGVTFKDSVILSKRIKKSNEILYQRYGKKRVDTKLEFFDDYVIKTYLDTDINRMSSLDNELYCIDKFSSNGSNSFCPKVEKLSENKYKIERFDFSLGTLEGINKDYVRRMLFSISFEEFTKQLKEIENILQIKRINHRDINPGNLLFSEKERRIKLIDFYWAKTDGVEPGNPPLLNNGFFHDDSKSIQKVLDQVKEVNKIVTEESKNIRSILSELGRVYRDGSSAEVGRTYHKIDISLFYDIPFSKDTKRETNEIFSKITCNPKKVLDVGCAMGYTTFNLMRRFKLDKTYGFESDPVAFSFLKECKRTFNLHELELYETIDHNTVIPKVDIIICCNVHMWIQKQLGKENTDILMKKLVSNCKELFFQTAGAESAGMYVIKELQNRDDIQKYLYSVGAKEVTFVSSTSDHGGLRHLFKVKGNL